MEFSSKEDIEAPIEQVFAQLSDLESIERQAMRRGIKVKRHSSSKTPEVGMEWTAVFAFRGKEMSADIKLDELTPHERIAFLGKSGGLGTELMIDLTALSPRRTRMTVVAQMQPKTLSARLLVQSLKLAKGRVNRKFSVRMAQYAKSIEERAQRSA